MVSRNKIPKEIRRQGAGPVKIGKGTSVEDIKRMRKDWEEAPMKGTAGPYNPQKMRLKKKKDTSVKVKKLPTSRKQRMSAAERKKLIGLGVHPGDIKYTLETRKYRKKPKIGGGGDWPDTPVPRKSKKSGGTVKKMREGKLHTKKTKTIDYKHHGGKLVANLYD